MDTLIKRRSVIKGQITKLVTYAKACKDTTPFDEMQIRLDKMKEHYNSFVSVENEIFSINADAQSDIEAVDDNYYLCVATLQRLMRTKIQTPSSSMNDTTLNASFSSPPADFKLPRLTLPTFSGKAREWQSFYDLFKSTVHENTNLSPAQKFQYLVGQLRGPAEKLIRHFRVDDASYIEAFKKLVKRYDRKRIIVNEFIETYMKQPQINKPSVETIGQMYDTYDEVIPGLKALGSSAESRDCWLGYLAEKKLDDITLQLWRQESSEQEFPTFEDFLKFLSNRMNVLEGLKYQPNKYQTRPSTPTQNFHVEAKPLPSCPLCTNQQHRLCDCPKFIQMKLEDRRLYLNNSARCINCLAEGHSAFQCRSKGLCHLCKKRHHSLVHADQILPSVTFEPKPSTKPDTTTLLAVCKTPNHPVQSLHSSHQGIGADALLPTSKVEIRDRYGNWQMCRALLDSASTRSYITEHCANRLNVLRSNARFNINTLNGGRAGSSRGVSSLLLRSRIDTQFSVELTAYIIPKITSNLPSKPVNREQFTPGPIDLLIGCDKFLMLLSDGQIRKGADQPVAQKTNLGWIVGGNYESNGVPHQTITCLSVQEEISIDQSLRRFWETEELPAVEQYTGEEKLCMEHFDKHLKIAGSGKFRIPLPFKPNKPALGNSLHQAVKRFSSLEQTLMKNPELHQTYSKFMEEYEELGHMELIPPDQIDRPQEKMYYLPHHPVIKEISSTTKLRVVFDATAKTTTGVSLNDLLMVGPTVQQSLIEILIRFRKHRYIITADIEKMFSQLWIENPDTDYQRIIWRTSPDLPVRHYRLLTNTYGTASASFMVTQALNKLSHLHIESHPFAAKILQRDFYMDDLMSGASTVDEARSMQSELISLLKLGGYHLRKWAANNVKLLENIPADDREISIREITEGTKLISVLGIKFDPQTDCFSFKVSLPITTEFTKRNMLSEASRVFDPMGWLSPVTIGIKILFQSLWLRKLDWDDLLPADVKEQWSNVRSKLKLLEEVKLSRWLNSDAALQLCGFADRHICSHHKFEWRSTDEHHFRENQGRTHQISLWSDSTTVLAWLANPPRKGNVFVINRVTEILSSTNVQQWSYVPSKQNPADIASRGILPNELITNLMWWQGPEWLRCEPLQPPEPPKVQKKEKIVALTNLAREEPERATSSSIIVAEIIEFSSITKAIRIFTWLKRAGYNFRNFKTRVIGRITQ